MFELAEFRRWIELHELGHVSAECVPGPGWCGWVVGGTAVFSGGVARLVYRRTVNGGKGSRARRHGGATWFSGHGCVEGTEPELTPGARLRSPGEPRGRAGASGAAPLARRRREWVMRRSCQVEIGLDLRPRDRLLAGGNFVAGLAPPGCRPGPRRSQSAGQDPRRRRPRRLRKTGRGRPVPHRRRRPAASKTSPTKSPKSSTTTIAIDASAVR